VVEGREYGEKDFNRIIEILAREEYTTSYLKQLGILCILDVVEKHNPPSNYRNNLFLITPKLHGFEDTALRFPTKIVALVIDGNTKTPSDY
jgi:hypothetical protein